MSLVEAVLAAQRERETIGELGTPEQRRCKSPFCDRALRCTNKSGYCYKCRREGPAKRWAEREMRLRRKAAGKCVHHCSRKAKPGYTSCQQCLDVYREHHQVRKQRPEWKARKQAIAIRYRHRMLKLGRCPQCGKDKQGATTYVCTPCVVYMRTARAAYARRKRAKAIEADRARARDLLAQIPVRAA